MDKDLLKKAMKTSISEVLEKMFFLPLDFSEASSPRDIWDLDVEPLIAVRLDFQGPLSGQMALFIPRKLGADLAADFMGGDPEAVPSEHVDQTAKEIINMVAGRSFSLLDEKAVFDLGIPEIVPVKTACETPDRAEDAVFLGIDTLESHLGLRLTPS